MFQNFLFGLENTGSAVYDSKLVCGGQPAFDTQDKNLNFKLSSSFSLGSPTSLSSNESIKGTSSTLQEPESGPGNSVTLTIYILNLENGRIHGLFCINDNWLFCFIIKLFSECFEAIMQSL